MKRKKVVPVYSESGILIEYRERNLQEALENLQGCMDDVNYSLSDPKKGGILLPRRPLSDALRAMRFAIDELEEAGADQV